MALFFKSTGPVKIEPSSQQKAIFRFLKEDQQHLFVRARAGTGKTWTIVEALKEVELEGNVILLAYNSTIVDELRKRVPRTFQKCVRTLHSFGNEALQKHIVDCDLQDPQHDTRKVYDHIDRLTAKHKYIRWGKGTRYTMKQAIGFVKNTVMIHPDKLTAKDVRQGLANRDCSFPALPFDPYQLIADTVRETFHDLTRYDYEDMLHVPYWADCPFIGIDTVFVDEAQDLDPLQRNLLLRFGKRFVVVGDDRQAIYAFRGADAHSLPNFKIALGEGTWKELPLTITRRVPKTGVRLAQTLVPDFESDPSAPEGTLDFTDTSTLIQQAKAGDMVLCRTNAPLVNLLYTFIQNGKRSYIRGRKELGEQLLHIVEELDLQNFEEFSYKLAAYFNAKMITFKEEQVMAKANLEDQVHVLEIMGRNSTTLKELTNKLHTIFKGLSDSSAIQLSSIHRAKGLEATNVYLYDGSLMPHRLATSDDELQQEMNLIYVAITRHKEKLTFVSSIPRCLQEAFTEITGKVALPFVEFDEDADLPTYPGMDEE